MPTVGDRERSAYAAQVAKVLLINPPSEPLGPGNRRITRVLYPPPPGGLASVASSLRAAGHRPTVLDLVVEPRTLDEVREIVDRVRPDAIGYSVLGPALEATREMAARLSDRVAKQFAGNALASEYPTWFLEQIPQIDAVVVGEGELTTPALVDAGFVGPVAGAVTRESLEFVPRPQIEDLDSLPFPAWDLLPAHAYRASPQLLMRSAPTLGLLQSRGCPWRCSFCAQNFAWPQVRYRSIESIGEEIERTVRDIGVRHFGFYDSIFPLKREFGEQLFAELDRRQLVGKVRFFCETRVDMVWQETFRWLQRAGLHLVFLGIETSNAGVLRTVGKTERDYDIEEAVSTLARAGLRTYGLFVIGMAGQDERDYRAIEELSCRLPLDVASFGIHTRYAGAYGVRGDSDVDPLQLTAVNWGANDGHGRELARVQRRLMRAFYLRPRVILKHLVRREIKLDRLVSGAVALATS